MIKTKLQVKPSSNLTNLCAMHLKKYSIYHNQEKHTKCCLCRGKEKVLVSLNKQRFSGCISVEHFFHNHLLIFASCIKTPNVMLHISP